MKEWLFFDLGSTLIDEGRAYQLYAERVAKRLKEFGRDVGAKEFLMTLTRMAEAGNPSLQAAWAAYNLPDILRPAWTHEGEELFPEVVETLSILSQSYSLGVIANQGIGLEERLEQFGIRRFFEVIVCSEEVGFRKPDEALFYHALSQVGASAQACVYIGDRYDNDILPAKRIGMKTIRILQGYGRFQSEEAEAPSDWMIHRIGELLDIFL